MTYTENNWQKHAKVRDRGSDEHICTINTNITHAVDGGGAGDRERQERHESKAVYRYVYEAYVEINRRPHRTPLGAAAPTVAGGHGCPIPAGTREISTVVDISLRARQGEGRNAPS